jgi:hypothetical protein
MMLVGLQLVLFLLFLPETQYIPDPSQPSKGRAGIRYWPWQRPREYLRLATRPILISHLIPLTAPAFYYGLVFGLSVGITVIVPRLLAEFYHFSTTSQGLSFLAYAVGSVFGKTAGGWFGDRVVLWKQRRTGERRPEYRLWAMASLHARTGVSFDYNTFTASAFTHPIRWVAHVRVGIASSHPLDSGPHRRCNILCRF